MSKSAVAGSQLSTYVPRILLNRFGKNDGDILVVPEETWSQGAVLFADISGFTPLTERMSKDGLKGIEMLSSYLNEFFDKLIQIIHMHGGDIIKFAGDALMALWTAPISGSLGPQVVSAAHCALQMLEDMKGYTAGGFPLTLHSGIGAGQISHLHVGGTNGRKEYLICGHFIDQVSECEKRAESGQVYISHNAFSIAAGYFHPKIFTLFITKKGRSKKKRPHDVDTCYLMTKVKQPAELPSHDEIAITKSIVEKVIPYCPEAIKGHGKGVFIAENRNISVLFVNLDLVYVSGQANLMQLQKGVVAMQTEIYKYRGEVRQFIVDDKGSVLIGIFGLPPESHEDDAVRAVLAALAISKELDAVSIQSRIGVTTGNAFCGDVGNDVRREYAMVGDIVNLSARLMGACQWGEVMCDNPTYQANLAASRGAKKEITFDVVPPIKVKGKTELIKVYTPRYRTENIGNDSYVDRKKKFVNNNRPSRATLFSRVNTLTLSVKVTPKLVGREKEMKLIMLILKHIYDRTWSTFCQSEEKKSLFGTSFYNSDPSSEKILTTTPSRPFKEVPSSRDSASASNSFQSNSSPSMPRAKKRTSLTSNHRNSHSPSGVSTPNEHGLKFKVRPEAIVIPEKILIIEPVSPDSQDTNANDQLNKSQGTPSSSPLPVKSGGFIKTDPSERGHRPVKPSPSSKPESALKKRLDFNHHAALTSSDPGIPLTTDAYSEDYSPSASRKVLTSAVAITPSTTSNSTITVTPLSSTTTTTTTTSSPSSTKSDSLPLPGDSLQVRRRSSSAVAMIPRKKPTTAVTMTPLVLPANTNPTIVTTTATTTTPVPSTTVTTPTSPTSPTLTSTNSSSTIPVPSNAITSTSPRSTSKWETNKAMILDSVQKRSHASSPRSMNSPTTASTGESLTIPLENNDPTSMNSLLSTAKDGLPIIPSIPLNSFTPTNAKDKRMTPRSGNSSRNSPRSSRDKEAPKSPLQEISPPNSPKSFSEIMRNEILPTSMTLKSSLPPSDVSKTEQSSTSITETDSSDTSTLEKVGLERSNSKAEGDSLVRKGRAQSTGIVPLKRMSTKREKSDGSLTSSGNELLTSPRAEGSGNNNQINQTNNPNSQPTTAMDITPSKLKISITPQRGSEGTHSGALEVSEQPTALIPHHHHQGKHFSPQNGSKTSRVRGELSEPHHIGTKIKKNEQVRVGEMLIGRLQGTNSALHKFLTHFESNKKEMGAVTNSAFLVLKAEAGYGKTALMNSVISELKKEKFGGANGDYVVLQSSCDSIEERTPYFPWRDIFGLFLNCLDISAAKVSQKKLEIIDKLETIMPGMGNYVSLLNPVLPLDWKELSEVTDLSESEKMLIREKLLITFLVGDGSKRILIFLDDAQWMDSCSWRLVEEILDKTQNILIVFAMRPMHPIPLILHRLMFKPNACVFELKGFDESSILSVVRQVLGVKSLPLALEKHLGTKDLSSPLLVREFAYELLASGAVEIKDDFNGSKAELTEIGWNMIRTKEVSKVPVTLKLMLTARIDRLQPNQKLILKEAAVIGFSFLFEILKSIHYLVQHTLVEKTSTNHRRLNRHDTVVLKNHLMNADKETTMDEEDEIVETLRQLSDFDLIECTNAENLTYSFKNSLIRDIVYDLILFKDKIIIHKAVYVWYERTFESDNDLSPFLTVIAHHAQEAGNLEKAVTYYSKAAQNAISTGAHKEAVKYLEEALKIDMATGKNLGDPTMTNNNKTPEIDNTAKEYRILQIHRLLAHSYYNMGVIENCITHLLASLKLMDVLPPEDGFETVFPPSAIAFNTPALNCAHLCSAVSKGALNEVISSLLNESVHLFINSVNEKGKTPLFLAAKKGNTDILMELLHCPAINPNCANLDGKNAVYAACTEGHTHSVALLLAHGTKLAIPKSEITKKSILDVINVNESEGVEGLKRDVPIVAQSFFTLHQKETHASNIPLSPREFAQDSKRLKENNKAVFQSPMSNSKKLESKTSSGKKIEKEKSKKMKGPKMMKLSPKALRYTSEIVSCLILLSKAYYFNCNNTLATHYCISASANGEFEIVQEYTTTIYKMINSFQLSSHDKDIWKYRGMHNSNLGYWADSSSDFSSALSNLKGNDINIHEVNEVKYTNAMNRFLVGDFSAANLGVFASIISTGDIQFLSLSLVSTAQIHYHAKKKALFFQIIGELEEFETLTSNMDACSIFCIHAIMIQSKFLRYQKDGAFQKLTLISKMLAKIKPKMYFILPVYIILPLILFGWILLLSPGDLIRQLKSLLDLILMEFEEFSHTCPIAVPYMTLWNTLRSAIDSPSEAPTKLQKVREIGNRLGLAGLSKMCDWWTERIQELSNTKKSDIDEEEILWSLFNYAPKSKEAK